MTHRGRTLAAVVLFVVLTAVMTWPQAARLTTAARQHQDVYFNMWRLEWFAHALATSPRHLFDGNIFYPERRAMTFSDAMFVEGLTAAPLLLLGVRPVLVHNLLLLSAIAASGIGMFVLARRLTSSGAAGIAAGIIFAFAPYRFEHFMHMELQWAMWIPWTFWALDRTVEGHTRVGSLPSEARPPVSATGQLRDGALTGLFLGLQVLSSIYYGVFLATLLAIGATLLMLPLRGMRLARTGGALVAGVIVAVALTSIYAAPYSATRQRVGGRQEGEIIMFSARPSNYLVATPDNLLYGHTFQGRGRAERRLFPGLGAVLLAIAGLLLRKPGATAVVYLILLVTAFEMSLGLSGYSYRFLYDHVPAFSAFRALARLGIFVLFFLAALAAFGVALILAAVPRRARAVAAVLIAGCLLVEYRVRPLRLVDYPNAAPPLYAWLAQQPAGIVAEFPMPTERSLPYAEPFYTYMSTFYWKPLVNGYSGYAPASYLNRLDQVAAFPDDLSLERLHDDGVRYVLVHPALYDQGDAARVMSALSARSDLVELGRFDDGTAQAVVYRLR